MTELNNNNINNRQNDGENQKEMNVIHLSDDTGFEMDFYILDTIEYEFVHYDVLVPASNTMEDEDFTNVLILKKELSVGNVPDYSIVEDKSVLDEVFNIFKSMHGNKDLFKD